MGFIQNIRINKNLKMAIGQLEGILKMILTKRESVEVSDQLNAVMALIKGCQNDIIKDELTAQIEDIVATPDAADRKAKTDKLVIFIDRMIR